MSEKATLLTKLPPVAKKTAPDPVKASSISTTKSSSSQTLLSAKSPSSESSTKPSLVNVSKTASTADTAKVSSQATTVEPASEKTISGFQVVTYASFVLTFILAGFAAVVLFRKAAKIAEQRFIISAKTFAIGAAIMALHGFFNTFLYTNYLRSTDGTAPLVFSMLVWIPMGVAIGIIVNHLLTPKEKPEMAAMIFDGCAYSLIFGCAMLGFSTGIKPNAAIIFSLLSCFLFIVPVARSFTTFRTAMVRHPELKEVSDQVLIYGLIFIPAIFPILSFLRVCGVGPDGLQFLVNFVTFDFLLVVGLSMLASADELGAESAAAESAAAETEVAAEPVAAVEVAPEPVAVAKAEAPKPAKQQERVVEFSTSSDAPVKKLPPRKPGRLSPETRRPEPPRKPGSVSDAEEAAAPNAPSRIKAPAKPKKRF
ncbi:hypothetical protein [Coraliomargarita parva]|uniref:hypothetical protein n=1 Tax=Coraliomargarita parva TaxID=3014050 RepID=UPI0022B4F544|nr:hypothetical protein [Coraliomargarita parva]